MERKNALWDSSVVSERVKFACSVQSVKTQQHKARRRRGVRRTFVRRSDEARSNAVMRSFHALNESRIC